MNEDNSVGINMIWAITILIIVAIIGGAIFYSGAFRGASPDKKIDVEVDLPAAPAPAK